MSERTQVTGLFVEVRGEAGEVIRVSAPRAAHRHDLLGDQKPGEDKGGRGREGGGEGGREGEGEGGREGGGEGGREGEGEGGREREGEGGRGREREGGRGGRERETKLSTS